MRIAFYGVMAAAIMLATQTESRNILSQIESQNELDIEAEVGTGLEACSQADLETYAEAILYAEAGTEALVIN